MAADNWTTPVSKSDGDLIDQTIWNNQVVNNLLHLLNNSESKSLTNRSGGVLSEGAVVIIDTGNDSSFTTTTTAANPLVLGVVADDAGIADAAAGRVAWSGVKTVLVQGNVTRGNYLHTSTTAGRAADAGASRTIGTFAIALDSYAGGGAGSVTALLMNSTMTGGVPANCVFFTSDATAPSGFSEYTAARGRAIVARPAGGTDEGTVGTALTDLEDRTHTHSETSHAHNIGYDFVDGAGIAWETIPPYGSSGSFTSVKRFALSSAAESESRNNNITSSTGGTTGTAATSNVMPYIQLLAIQKD